MGDSFPLGSSVDAVHNPLQYPHIFPVAWPDESSIRILAEPVHVKDVRRAEPFRQVLANWRRFKRSRKRMSQAPRTSLHVMREFAMSFFRNCP